MPYEKFQVQKEIKRKNEELILIELKESPRQFKEFIGKLKLSPMGLTNILKRLVNEEKIQKVLHEGHEAYGLTEKGEKIVRAIPILLDNIETILRDKHKYQNIMGKFHSGYRGISFDVLNDIHVDPKLGYVFKRIVEKTVKKVDNKIADIPDIVKDESVLSGKMVLAITIDFDDMKQQFLNRNNKQWKKFAIDWKNEEKWLKLFKTGDSQ